MYNWNVQIYMYSGADPGGGGSWRSGAPPPLPFGGPRNFIKREKTSRVCARKCRILVISNYPPPPFLKSCIHPCVYLYFIRSQSYTLRKTDPTGRGATQFALWCYNMEFIKIISPALCSSEVICVQLTNHAP